MKKQREPFAIPAVCLALLIGQANGADDTVGHATSETAPAAREKYEKLMQHAEGNGRGCMITKALKDEMLGALKAFGKAVHFIDLAPDRPIKVELPEDYYHPSGRIITFDQFELVINRQDPEQPYISLTRTSEGVKLEPKIVIDMRDDKFLCVRSLSATVSYQSTTP